MGNKEFGLTNQSISKSESPRHGRPPPVSVTSTNMRDIGPLHFVGVYILQAFQNRKHGGARRIATVLLIS